jgi:hypothetical protein
MLLRLLHKCVSRVEISFELRMSGRWPESLKEENLCREILIGIGNVISEWTTTAADAAAVA